MAYTFSIAIPFHLLQRNIVSFINHLVYYIWPVTFRGCSKRRPSDLCSTDQNRTRYWVISDRCSKITESDATQRILQLLNSDQQSKPDTDYPVPCFVRSGAFCWQSNYFDAAIRASEPVNVHNKPHRAVIVATLKLSQWFRYSFIYVEITIYFNSVRKFNDLFTVTMIFLRLNNKPKTWLLLNLYIYLY